MKKTFLKLIYATGAFLVVSTMQSCNTEKLTDLNRNPNAIEYVIPEYSFTAAVLASGPGENYRALGQGLQYFSSYKEVPATGDKFYNFNGTAGNFGVYTGQWNRLLQLVKEIPGPENVNKRAAIEILRILAFHQQTDVMGDMPYSESMKGLDKLKPKYDTQKSIYTAMLTELETALKSMDATKPNVFGTADPYFRGDVARWSKFGYTLMARLGMRLSDIEPATAKTWVEKAVAGGMMTSFADIAYLKYANIQGQMNPRVLTYINGDFTSPGGDNIEGSKWSGKFIDHLKATSDPRLPVISVVWVPAGGNNFTPNNTPATQRGMVSGSLNTRPTDFDSYSEPSLLYIDRGAPIIVMSSTEAYLIIAEAAARGWSVGSTAQAAYNNAVRAAMAEWALWPSVAPHSGVITTAQVDAYLAANPYPATGTLAQQIETISTQKWVSMLGNDYEVYSNWRRTKFPVFNYANWTVGGNKVPYPGNVTAGKMWRRFSLPIAERNVNPDNYFEAIKRQNFSEEQIDLLQGRMWWDVGPGTGQSN